jgi:hypothetical protein
MLNAGSKQQEERLETVPAKKVSTACEALLETLCLLGTILNCTSQTLVVHFFVFWSAPVEPCSFWVDQRPWIVRWRLLFHRSDDCLDMTAHVLFAHGVVAYNACLTAVSLNLA